MVKVQTLSRTGLHTALYPVQGREAKNYTLSSGTSPYRPYKGVPPSCLPFFDIQRHDKDKSFSEKTLACSVANVLCSL